MPGLLTNYGLVSLFLLSLCLLATTGKCLRYASVALLTLQSSA